MSPANRIGWLTLLSLAALALVLAIAARCKADGSTLADRLVLAQRSAQSQTEESVDARELATAIASIPRVNRQWAALVLTVAIHESSLLARIARGDCKRYECDGGRAWGLFQVHRNQANRAVWGSREISVQTLEGARMLRAAFYTCGGLQPDWQIRTLRAYAGRKCNQPLKGEQERLATFRRLEARL